MYYLRKEPEEKIFLRLLRTMVQLYQKEGS